MLMECVVPRYDLGCFLISGTLHCSFILFFMNDMSTWWVPHLELSTNCAVLFSASDQTSCTLVMCD